MKILDSDMLVGILRKNEDAKIKYEKTEGDISTTIFNAQEIYFGALISDNPEKNFNTAKSLLESIEMISYDEKSMKENVQ